MASSDQQNNSFLLGLLGAANQSTINQKLNAPLSSPSSSAATTTFTATTTNTIPSFLSNTQVARSDPIVDNVTNTHVLTNGIGTAIPPSDPSKDLAKYDSLLRVAKPPASTLTATTTTTATTPLQRQAFSNSNNNGRDDNREFLANLLDNVASQSQLRSRPVISPPLEMTHGEEKKTAAGDMDFDALLAFHEGSGNGKKKSKKKRSNKSKSAQHQRQQQQQQQQQQKQQRPLYNSNPSSNNSSSNLDILTVANEGKILLD